MFIFRNNSNRCFADWAKSVIRSVIINSRFKLKFILCVYFPLMLFLDILSLCLEYLPTEFPITGGETPAENPAANYTSYENGYFWRNISLYQIEELCNHIDWFYSFYVCCWILTVLAISDIIACEYLKRKVEQLEKRG